MNQFYGLFPEDKVLFGRKWAYIDDARISNVGEPEKCPVCGNPVSMLDWLPPHEIRLSTIKSHKLGDFLWGPIFPFLISEKVKQLIANHEIRGMIVHENPVTITNPSFNRDKNYYKVKVEWNGANRDDTLSGAVYTHVVCPYCRGGSIGKKMSRIVLEESSLKSLDVFEARGIPGFVLINAKFKDLLIHNDITNCKIIPIQDISYDETAIKLWKIE